MRMFFIFLRIYRVALSLSIGMCVGVLSIPFSGYAQNKYAQNNTQSLLIKNVAKRGKRRPKSFINANLEGVLWEGKNFNGVDFSYANLRYADLRRCSFRNADFYKADLRGAYLEKANLRGASLVLANLERANLRWTNLQRANLMGAHLRGANLEGTRLEESNLRHANLTLVIVGSFLHFSTRFEGAYYSSRTLFPEWFDPKVYKLQLAQ